jgi:IS30 family transposase
MSQGVGVGRARRIYTAAERRELWARWKAGESVSDIARALDRAPGTIHCTLREHGGVVPVERRRAARALQLSEREEISRGIAAGESARHLARRLGRAPSTITREIARNGGRRRYRAAPAEERAWRVARRPQPCKLAANQVLRELVAAKLAEDWSPQQIAGWLKVQHPDDPDMHVSHETIYLTLLIQARGALRRELISHLRRLKSVRRPKGALSNSRGQGQIRDAVSIRDRPTEAEDRAIPGHWEGDLLAGAANTHLATLVERTSRFAMLVKVSGKDAATVVDAITAKVVDLPAELRRSLTWDRGAELARHRQFTVATDVAVYFCDPQSPWQRGTNENTNGLLRQYLPKGTDLSRLSQDDLDTIALKLNGRPRKTLGYMTPADRLEEVLR